MKLVQTRNTQAYLGYSDWRVPNIKELASLLDDGCDGVKINTEVFKDTGYLGWFWSSSVDPNSRTNALRLNIHTGEVGSEYKGSESGTGYYGHIRLVRDAD